MLETIERLREFIMHLKSQTVGGLKNDQKFFRISTLSMISETNATREIERLSLKLDKINKLDR